MNLRTRSSKRSFPKEKAYEVESLDQLPEQISIDIHNEIVIHYHEYCNDWLVYDTDAPLNLKQVRFNTALFLGPQKVKFGNFPATKTSSLDLFLGFVSKRRLKANLMNM